MRTPLSRPAYVFDCEECGQPYEVWLGCVNPELTRAAVLAEPKRCPDCREARPRALRSAHAP